MARTLSKEEQVDQLIRVALRQTRFPCDLYERMITNRPIFSEQIKIAIMENIPKQIFGAEANPMCRAIAAKQISALIEQGETTFQHIFKVAVSMLAKGRAVLPHIQMKGLAGRVWIARQVQQFDTPFRRTAYQMAVMLIREDEAGMETLVKTLLFELWQRR